MERNGRKPRTRAVPALSAALCLALAGAASAQFGGGPSSLGDVQRFRAALTKAGFAIEEGAVEYIDLVKECCLGRVPDTLANNPWPNAYVTIKFPQAAGVTLPEWIWQLREDEAVVLVGRTPPRAAYFSYQTFFSFLPDDLSTRLGIAVGDTTNIATINTHGHGRADKLIVYIVTGHRGTERRVRSAALSAGYPASTLNVEAISPVLAPLGRGPSGSWFYLAHRTAMADDQAELERYIRNPPYVVFRVTPRVALPSEPQRVPELRVRGTGRTEMELYPALKRLRQAILDRYSGRQATELDTHVWWLLDKRVHLEKPFVGLQRRQFLMGATRDTNYLATYENFPLRDDSGEFAIVYGVNHQRTGKATYSSVSLYADPDRWFGLATLLSRDFGDSAEQYLPGDPDAHDLYAWKVARRCDGERYCLEVKQPDFKDINGETYTCTPPLVLNEQPMFFIFRTYMEPSTKVAPDDNELLYDRAIHFGL